MTSKSSAGKGDMPRPCNIEKYKANYDKINWSKKLKRKSYYPN